MRITNDNVQAPHGLIFMPDISGYTAFVQSTNFSSGKEIVYELLSVIISENRLKLNISEIEGDAVLFYRHGIAPTSVQLLNQSKLMVDAFETKRKELQNRFAQTIDLSLKFIAHYGPIGEFKIGAFNKLYGETVIEAHRLLKNSIDGDTYLLLTDSLLEMSHDTLTEMEESGIRSNKLCEVYGSLRSICFTYFNLESIRTNKKEFLSWVA